LSVADSAIAEIFFDKREMWLTVRSYSGVPTLVACVAGRSVEGSAGSVVLAFSSFPSFSSFLKIHHDAV
ncbi:hypothetical protein, partial [Leucobacter musarum]|uniref:hypothetical protein n=1 Tax=Leucobacter musarum TaxID=1930747 RepID=UPI001955C18D